MVKKKGKSNYHAVAMGRMVGIVSSWPAAEALVECFPHSRHKGFTNLTDAKEWLTIWKPSGDSVKIIPDETALAVDRSVKCRVDRPSQPSRPGNTPRDGKAQGSSVSRTKIREKPNSQKLRSFKKEMALAKAASEDDQISQVRTASLASLSSEAFRAGVPSLLDASFVADERFLSEDLDDFDASMPPANSEALSLPKSQLPSTVNSAPPAPLQLQPFPSQDLAKNGSDVNGGNEFLLPASLDFAPFSSQTTKLYYSDDQGGDQD